MKVFKSAGTARAALVGVSLFAAISTAVAVGGGSLWLSSGQDRTNSRHQSQATTINATNVSNLQVKWHFQTEGNVSATPSVDGRKVYFPDFAGYMYALDRNTGAVVWQQRLADYGLAGVPSNNYARSTPTVAGALLIFGDQGGRAALEGGQVFATGSARVMAVSKHTGDLVWSTQVDANPAAIVTAGVTVHGDVAFVGVASYEEAYAAFIPAAFYTCCSARGSVVALDVNSGAILWKTYMAPAGYSGNGVWGSAPVVDTKRNTIYVGTGNNYSVPDDVTECILANEGDPDSQHACLAADNYVDSVVALDMATGAVKWDTSMIPFDTWNVGCLFDELPDFPIDPAHCPVSGAEGPDFDFGQAPMLYTVGQGKDKQDRLGIGQKSGQFWSLDAETGEVMWVTQAGPGGVAGGSIWGSANDGERMYVAEANSFAAEWTPVGGAPTNSGGWAALDAGTGEVLWQSANPVPVAPAGGAASVANGVLYGCAQSSFIEGFLDPSALDNMFAIDAATGDILWSHYSGGACNSGAAIVDGAVYWGYGFPGDTGAAQGHGFYAFGLAE